MLSAHSLHTATAILQLLSTYRLHCAQASVDLPLPARRSCRLPLRAILAFHSQAGALSSLGSCNLVCPVALESTSHTKIAARYIQWSQWDLQLLCDLAAAQAAHCALRKDQDQAGSGVFCSVCALCAARFLVFLVGSRESGDVTAPSFLPTCPFDLPCLPSAIIYRASLLPLSQHSITHLPLYSTSTLHSSPTSHPLTSHRDTSSSSISSPLLSLSPHPRQLRPTPVQPSAIPTLHHPPTTPSGPYPLFYSQRLEPDEPEQARAKVKIQNTKIAPKEEREDEKEKEKKEKKEAGLSNGLASLLQLIA